MTVDLPLEVEAYTQSVVQGRPVWVEAPNRMVWVAHDPLSGCHLRLVLRSPGRFRRPRWCLYATNRDGITAKAVMCETGLDPSIHIAENIAARNRFHFPTTTEETP